MQKSNHILKKFRESLKMGNEYFESKNFQQAINSYDKAICIDASQSEVYYNKGAALSELNNFKEAIEAYDMATKLNKNNYDAYLNKGNAYKELKKNSEALKCYDMAIKINPENPDSYYNKGIVLSDLNKFEEAIRSYNLAITFDATKADFYHNKAIALSETNNFLDAIKAYDQAIKLDTSNPDSYINKGNALSEIKKFDEAIESYEKAIKLDSRNTLAYNNKAVALYTINKFDDAIKAYNISIKLNENNPVSYANRGNLYLTLNKNSEALQDYKKAQSLLDKNITNGLSQKNINNIKDNLTALIKLQNSVDVLEKEILKIENSSTPKYFELMNKKTILEKEKNFELKNLNFSKKTPYSNPENYGNNINDKIEMIINKNLELAKEVKKLKSEVKNIKSDISSMRKDISLKLNDYQKIFEEKIKKCKKDQIKKAKDYYFGFSSTFSNLYITSILVDSGQVQLDVPSDMVVSILSSICTLIPYVGSTISETIDSLGLFLKTMEMKENARTMIRLVEDPLGLSQLVGKTLAKIIEKENKKIQIFEVTEKNIKPKVRNWIKKIINFCEKIYQDIEKKLYGEVYDTPAKKLGNLDANEVIGKYIKKEFEEYCIYEDEFSKFVVELEENKINEEELNEKDIEVINKNINSINRNLNSGNNNTDKNCCIFI